MKFLSFKENKNSMISVYHYIDYRRFLKDRFLAIKEKQPHFSFRTFNRRAGLKSSGFLKLVMDKRRNLAGDGIQKIARGFQLSENERGYFELLVRFNQALSNEEKDRYFQKLSGHKKFIAAKPLTAFQFRLFAHWYYVAILECVRMDSTELKTVRWVHQAVHPLVPFKQIKHAVADLKKWGLLEEGRMGELKRLDSMLTTEDEVASVSVANFHVQMCQMAARAVMKEEAADREFSALTIAISEKGFQKAKAEIQKFRKQIHSLLEQESEEAKTLVAHLNFHLFKLSRRIK